MKKGSIVILILIALVVLGGCNACSVNNNLVTHEETTKAGWGEVENQYQRRNDLIGNLVETVKGYAKHEQSTLTGVIEARAKASQITVNPDDLTPEKLQQIQQAQGQLSQALGKLMMLQEQYPNLKADAQFLKLQDELAGTENRLAVARQRYNESVKDYNTYLRKMPNKIYAGFLGFSEKGMFAAEEGAKAAPEVKF